MSRFKLHRIGVANEQAGTRPTLHDCIQAVIAAADTLMREVLDGLTGLSSKTRFNSAFTCPVPVSKGMTDLLSAQKSLLIATFIAELELGIRRGCAQDGDDRATTPYAELKLLDGDQMDASFELAVALQEVSRCVDDVLPSVDALVSSLAGWTTVQPQLNPLKAEVFVNALLATLRQHVPGGQERTALLVPSAGLLGVSLRQFYREICDWLRSCGVEPAWPVGVCLGTGNPVSLATANNSVSRTMAMLDKFRRLLSGEADRNPRGQDFLPTVPFSYVALEDLKLLKPMMQRLTDRGSQAAETAGSEILPGQAALSGQAGTRPVSAQLGEEVVRLMLDSLLLDEKLLPEVRDLVKGLEPALLGLARSDPRFFSDRQHAARQFLEWLIGRGLTLGTGDEPQFRRFLVAATAAVDALNGRDGGAALFESVLRKLETDWPLRKSAQSLADEFAKDRLNAGIPDLMAGFVSRPWHQVASHS